MKYIVLSSIFFVLLLCSCGTNASKRGITSEMAYEGVSNFCHSTYDWSKDGRRDGFCVSGGIP